MAFLHTADRERYRRVTTSEMREACLIDELRGVGRCASAGESVARTSRVLDKMVKGYYKKS